MADEKPVEEMKAEAEQKAEPNVEHKAEKRLPKWGSQLSPQTREKYADSLDAYADKSLSDVFEEWEAGKAKMKNSIPVPTKDSSAEEKKAFLKAMGIPEKYEEYTLKSELVKEDNPFLIEFKKHAHKMGLTNEQAQKQLDYVLNIAKSADDAQKETRKNLEKTFSANMTKLAGDKAEEVVNLAKKNLARFGDKELLEAFKAANLDVNPKFLAKLAEFERTLSDATFIPGGGKPQEPGKGEFGTSYDPKFLATYGGR